jgi:Holliday junction resolvase-like predicted endonuclease
MRRGASRTGLVMTPRQWRPWALRRDGWTILAERHRNAGGELDLIAEKTACSPSSR